MKQPRNLSVSERIHISKSIANPRDWKISKKETHTWLIVHRFTNQEKEVLAPCGDLEGYKKSESCNLCATTLNKEFHLGVLKLCKICFEKSTKRF